MAEGQEHAQGQGVDPVITAWQAMTAEIAQLNHDLLHRAYPPLFKNLTETLKISESG